MLTINFNEIDIYEIIKQNYNDLRIQSIIESLPEEEQTVLNYRTGIAGEKLSRNAIANILNTTLDRVRGMEERLLKHLKHPARVQYLNEVVDPNFTASEKAKEFFNKQNKKM